MSCVTGEDLISLFRRIRTRSQASPKTRLDYFIVALTNAESIACNCHHGDSQIVRANPSHSTCNKNLQQHRAYGRILAFSHISASTVSCSIPNSNDFGTIGDSYTCRFDVPMHHSPPVRVSQPFGNLPYPLPHLSRLDTIVVTSFQFLMQTPRLSPRTFNVIHHQVCLSCRGE